MKIIACILLFALLLARSNAAVTSLDLFSCDDAAEPNVSAFYSLKEEANLARADCEQQELRGESCSSYFSLSSRLILEDFKIQCDAADFLESFSGALESNAEDVLDSINGLISEIGAGDPLSVTIDDALNAAQSAFLEPNSSTLTQSTFEGRIRTLTEDDTRYTSDQELEDFQDAIEVANSDLATTTKNSFTTSLNTIFDGIVEDLVDSTDGTFEERILAQIAATKAEIITLKNNAIAAILKSQDEEVRRYLELSLGAPKNEIKNRMSILSAILPQSALNPFSFKDRVAQLAEETYRHSQQVQSSNCCGSYLQTGQTSSGLIKVYNAYADLYQCLLDTWSGGHKRTGCYY